MSRDKTYRVKVESYVLVNAGSVGAAKAKAEVALQMHAGIHVNQRELAEIALRMFDAREVLG